MQKYIKIFLSLFISCILALCCSCGRISITFGDSPDNTSTPSPKIQSSSSSPSDNALSTSPSSNITSTTQLTNSGLNITSSKEAEEVINFATQFYTDWFEMKNSNYNQGNPDFKVYDSDLDIYSPNYEAFYNTYASQDADVSNPQFYTMDLYDDMVLDSRGRVDTKHSPDKPPSAIRSLVKSADAVKILSGSHGIYKVGVLLTIEGEQVGTDLVVETNYMGTCTVVLEETGFKIENYTSYNHSEQCSTDKSKEFLEAFKSKLLGNGSEIDVIKDANLTDSSEGVVIESTILLDEKNDTSNNIDTSELDIKKIIKANDSKTVTFLGPTSQGSGFIIAPGVVATNYHVIADQTEGTIRFVDGTTVDVEGVIDYNPNLDIAILKLSSSVGEPVILGDSNTCSKADPVLAIGSPLGLYNTVTVGLFNNVWEENGIVILQSSLPLAPGNSGGPLFNSNGQVIGINTMIMSGYADISLAVDIKHLINNTNGWQNTPYSNISCQSLSTLF